MDCKYNVIFWSSPKNLKDDAERRSGSCLSLNPEGISAVSCGRGFRQKSSVCRMINNQSVFFMVYWKQVELDVMEILSTPRLPQPPSARPAPATASDKPRQSAQLDCNAYVTHRRRLSRGLQTRPDCRIRHSSRPSFYDAVHISIYVDTRHLVYSSTV